jgi:hypothetical protein
MVSQNTKLRQSKINPVCENQIAACVKWFGLYRVLWMDLTLLPSTPQKQVRPVSFLWNKFNAAFLCRSPLLVGWLRILDASKYTGRLHVHGLLVTKAPVCRRAYPAELQKGQTNPRSLNSAGAALARLFEQRAKASGFGISYVEPIKTNATAVSKYLSKSFRADIFDLHPHLVGAQRFRMSARLKNTLAGLQTALRLRTPHQNGYAWNGRESGVWRTV